VTDEVLYGCKVFYAPLSNLVFLKYVIFSKTFDRINRILQKLFNPELIL